MRHRNALGKLYQRQIIYLFICLLSSLIISYHHSSNLLHATKKHPFIYLLSILIHLPSCWKCGRLCSKKIGCSIPFILHPTTESRVLSNRWPDATLLHGEDKVIRKVISAANDLSFYLSLIVYRNPAAVLSLTA